jgi:hypothetical protein
MKIKDVINRLNNGDVVSDVAQELNISKDTLNRRLKNWGYEWDNSAKIRVYKGNEPEPLEIDMIDVITGNKSSNLIVVTGNKGAAKSDTKMEQNRLVQKQGNKQVITGNPEFTKEEIVLLKEWAREWQSRNDNVNQPALPQPGNKVRKTFHIDENYITQIDDFAQKHRLSKSDVVHMALHKFFQDKKGNAGH